MARKRLLAVLVGQWLVLGAMVGLTFADLSAAVTTALVMALAAGQALSVLWFDMRLSEAPALVRLVAFGAAGWLSVLFGLGLADWLTR